MEVLQKCLFSVRVIILYIAVLEKVKKSRTKRVYDLIGRKGMP